MRSSSKQILRKNEVWTACCTIRIVNWIDFETAHLDPGGFDTGQESCNQGNACGELIWQKLALCCFCWHICNWIPLLIPFLPMPMPKPCMHTTSACGGVFDLNLLLILATVQPTFCTCMYFMGFVPNYFHLNWIFSWFDLFHPYCDRLHCSLQCQCQGF